MGCHTCMCATLSQVFNAAQTASGADTACRFIDQPIANHYACRIARWEAAEQQVSLPEVDMQVDVCGSHSSDAAGGFADQNQPGLKQQEARTPICSLSLNKSN